jgi:hypothetical protein
MSQFNCRIDAETLELLKSIAKAGVRSKSQTVRFLVRQEFGKLAAGSAAAPVVDRPAQQGVTGVEAKEVMAMD